MVKKITSSEVIALFTNNYDKRYYLREIAELLGKPHQTVKPYIEELVKKGVLIKDKRKNIVDYYRKKNRRPVILGDDSINLRSLAADYLNPEDQLINQSLADTLSDAIEMLQSFDWPGNIRQLQNVIQRVLISCDNVIKREDVLNVMGSKKVGTIAGPEFWFGDKILAWKEMENIFRWRYFNYVKGKTKSESEAARQLGIAPSNFYRMCNKLGIK